jgi:hypothetical protein
MDKPEIMAWWREQPFDLNLLEHQGNCKWCWKKSFRKHARIVRESPWVYDFPRRMEAIYGHVMPEQERERMQRPTGLFGLVREPRRVFFRGGLSTDALFLKVLSLPPHGDERERPDEDAGCSESCELFPTEIVDA